MDSIQCAIAVVQVHKCICDPITMINSLTHPAVLKPMLIFTYHFKCTIHMIHYFKYVKIILRTTKKKSHLIPICQSKTNHRRLQCTHQYYTQKSVSIIKRTLKEQSSQCIHISRNISKYKRTLKGSFNK